MPEKRKTAPSEPGNGSPYTKRSRPSQVQATFHDDADGDSNDEEQQRSSSRFTPAYERPRNNPLYGQKSAFPGLDDPNAADELFYGPAEDGIEYLRMVR
jgi:regulator of vacuolar morphogenesis